MPHSHTDNLVIAAHGEVMLNILRVFARDLASNAVVGEFDEDFESIENTEELFRVMQPFFGDHYWLASSYTSGLGFVDGLREKAEVTLYKRGSLYVLRMSYYMVRKSNLSEISRFASSFSPGEYGIGFLSIEERDVWDKKMMVLKARGTDKTRWEVVRDDKTSLKHFWPELEGCREAWTLGETDDLATIACNMAMCTSDSSAIRFEGGNNFIEAHFEVVGKCGTEHDERWSAWTPVRHISPRKVKKQVEHCLSLLPQFPTYLCVNSDAFVDGMPSDTLMAGDKVELRVRYFSSLGKRCMFLDAHSEEGRIGGVRFMTDNSAGYWSAYPDDSVQVFALLLPYLSVSIESVVPITHWRGRDSAHFPKLVLKAELRPVNLEDLVKGIEQRIDIVINGNRNKGGVSW